MKRLISIALVSIFMSCSTPAYAHGSGCVAAFGLASLVGFVVGAAAAQPTYRETVVVQPAVVPVEAPVVVTYGGPRYYPTAGVPVYTTAIGVQPVVQPVVQPIVQTVTVVERPRPIVYAPPPPPTPVYVRPSPPPRPHHRFPPPRGPIGRRR